MSYELVGDVSEDFTGTAKHIRLEAEVDVLDYNGDVKETTRDFVISSTFVPFSGAETFVFPADSDGKVTSWGELETSRKGSANWEDVAVLTAKQAEDGEIRG